MKLKDTVETVLLPALRCMARTVALALRSETTRLLLAMVAGGAIVTSIHASSLREVRTTSITLVDREGRVRATLAADESGEAGLWLYDSDQRPAGSFTINRDGVSLIKPDDAFKPHFDETDDPENSSADDETRDKVDDDADATLDVSRVHTLRHRSEE